MGLETKYPELGVLAQFFVTDDEVEWSVYDAPFHSECEVLYVHGFSPYVIPLIEWLEKDIQRELVFIEDRLAALKRMEEEEAQSVLEHPQVSLRFYLGDVSLKEFVAQVVRDFPFEKVEVLSTNEELKRLLYRKSTVESAVHIEMTHYHKLCKNLLRNFKRLPDAFHVGLWKDRFQGTPAVICGAGPSLSEELSELEGKALIMAGGSAITALTSKGIMPNLLFAIDPNQEEFTRLAFHTAYDVPMIFGCRLEPNVLYSHAGPIGYMTTGTGGVLEEWMEKQLGIEDHHVLKGLGPEALSVTAIAFMTAIYLGCDPIILAGVDLSYDQGKRYTSGVISDFHCQLEERPKHAGEVVLQEEELGTLTKWVMERDVLDDVCDLYPERSFLKMSPKGLTFRNIPYDPDWKKRLGPSRNIRKEVTKAVMETPLSVTPGEVGAAIEGFFESMKMCKRIVFEMIEELKGLYPNLEGRETTQKIMVLEMDLSEEVAFKTALQPASYALTFQVKRLHRPSQLPRNLYHIKMGVYLRLQAIIDEYLR